MDKKCSNYGKVKDIKMRCNFCDDGVDLCKECASEHRSWYMVSDDWEFIS